VLRLGHDEAEWQVVRESLPVPAWLEGRGSRLEGNCHRQMVDVVRYVADSGLKLNLPVDFPPFTRVHVFARRWQVQGLLTELHDRLRDRVRQKEAVRRTRRPQPWTRSPCGAAANIPRPTSGWDGGKNAGGRRKRDLVVDCLVLVLAVVVTAASVQDCDAAVPPLDWLRSVVSGPVRSPSRGCPVPQCARRCVDV
jgi:transposase